MKHISRNLVVLAVFAVALTGLALAQQFAYRVAASVPYDFNVGDQHFTAGNYLFVVDYGDHAVTIKNQDTGRSSVALASPVVYASPGYDTRNGSPDCAAGFGERELRAFIDQDPHRGRELCGGQLQPLVGKE